MNFNVEKKENNIVTFKAEIEEDKFERAIDRAYLKIRNKFNVAGFRKGKAPKKIIELNYGESIFYEEALNILLPEAYEEAVKKLELEPVDQPQVDIEQLEKGKPVILKLDVTVKPEVKLGDYKSIEIEKAKYNVTEEDVKKEIENMQDMNSRLIDADDKEAENGDILTINFEGYMNGEKFEGGTAENQNLELGSKKFIPGFEEQLIGKKVGEKVDVNVKFPDDYFEEKLKSKDALFKVEIKEIKIKEKPKLDDEFAKDVSEFDTLDELKSSIKEKLEKEAKDKEKVENETKAIEKLMEISEVEIPEVMIDRQIDDEVSEFDYRLKMQGLSLDKYFEFANTSLEKLKEQFKERSGNKVKSDLVLGELAKQENIQATEEEIDKEIEKIAAEYNPKDTEKFKEDVKKGDLEWIKSGIIKDKAIELLIKNVKFV